MLKIRKRWLKFPRHRMRKQDSEKLSLTGHIEGKQEAASNLPKKLV